MSQRTTTMNPASTEELSRQMSQGSEPQPRQTEAEDYRNAPLFPTEVSQKLRESWTDVQAAFVDEPRQAVQRADELVATAIKELADTFARERSSLEQQWDRGGDVSTEDLRVALTRYRSFFHRLLTM
jgi:hypothetical protein